MAKKQEFNDVPQPRVEIHNLTLKELYKEIGLAIKQGLGDKKVLITDDDECNGFHCLFHSVTEINEDFLYCAGLPFGVTRKSFLNDYVILG